MKYRAAIAWIAENDDEDIGATDPGFILTICMVADLFGKPPETVAKAVLAYRKRNK